MAKCHIKYVAIDALRNCSRKRTVGAQFVGAKSKKLPAISFLKTARSVTLGMRRLYDVFNILRGV